MKKGFTLIELLVVIAIIGLLASIVLVNLQGTRGRGRVAAGKQFASSLQHTLGDQAVGIWRLDEGSGTTAYDNAGYSNNGTLTGGPTWKTESECGLGLGSCLDFNGTTAYINAGNSSTLDLTDQFTVSAWVYARTGPASQGRTVASRYKYLTGLDTGWNFGAVWTTPDFSFQVHDGAGNNKYATYSNYYVTQLNQWNHMVAVYKASQYIELYMNGQRVANSTTVIPVISYTLSNPVTIGRRSGDAQSYFDGMIDDVAIYASALTTAEIQQLYAEGREKHLAEQ
ncbi:MAG: LamG-like jellyroll fold domain-containing protein [bacterium]|nr:LamG-like jellyroll fold domain-containing protein [bacterium]